MRDNLYQGTLEIVGRVLRVDTVDVRQDFFDLGASSLSIMQILSLLEHELGARVTLTDALDAPDIETFVQLVADSRG